MLIRAGCCLLFQGVRENLPEGFGHTEASAMLIFLPRGGPFCSPLKLETLGSCGARAEADNVRLWEGFTFPRGMRSKGSKCRSDARFLGNGSPWGGANASELQNVRKRRPTGHPAKRRARGGCVERDRKPVLTSARRCLTFPLRLSRRPSVGYWTF